MNAIDVERAADALYCTGHRMFEHGRTRDAMDVFRAMLLMFPSDERGWLALGLGHEEVGQRAVAIELLTMATLAVPNAVRARLALARALRESGRDADAESVLDDAEAKANESEDEDLIALVHQVRGAS